MDWHTTNESRSFTSYDPTIGRCSSDSLIVVAELFIWPDMTLLPAAVW